MKTIKIKNCIYCPHIKYWGMVGSSYVGKPDEVMIEMRCGFYDRILPNQKTGIIPLWCPLEDYDEK